MNPFNLAFLQIIDDLEYELQRQSFWQDQPPSAQAFLSEQPFALDTMASCEWLQWVFIPKIRALSEANAPLPRNFELYPYFEQTLPEQAGVTALLALIERLDKLVKA